MPIRGFFSDANKKELMGSEVLFTCDGRFNRSSAIFEAKRQAKMNIPRGRAVYVRLFRGSISNPHFYTGYIDLRN